MIRKILLALGLVKYNTKDIHKVLGVRGKVRNGVGYGFISTPDLFNNQHLEIGFGYSLSGRGDWGGGADRSSTSPLKVVIDNRFNIINVKTDSFYNSQQSKENEKKAKAIVGKLGSKLVIKDPDLDRMLKDIFQVIELKEQVHLGIEFDYGQMECSLDQAKQFRSKVIDSAKGRHNDQVQ